MKIIFRIIGESISLSLRELRVNKLRTLLTLLGIAIGIFCIIAVFTSVDSMENNLRSSIDKLGNNVVYITKFPWAPENGESEYPWWKYINRPYGKPEELKLIQANVPAASAAALSIWMDGEQLKSGDLRANGLTANGVTQDFDQIMNLKFSSGRYFTPSEMTSGTPEAIIGSEVVKNLFPATPDPVGQFVEYRGDRLLVIGVFAQEGKSLVDITNDDVFMMPYNYLTSKVEPDGFNIEPQILVKAKDGMSLDELKSELRGVMRGIRRIPPGREDNFSMNQISVLSAQISALFSVFDWVAIIIGGFAILVGGFGIANIMFVSVRERTNLIGIKKALGAKNFFILLEFMIEAVVLSVLGGVIGLFLVWLVVTTLSHAIEFDLILNLTNIIRGILIASFIGLIAGFSPALAAARLSPVEAIRFK